MIKLNFKFPAKVWIYKGKAAWHFITVPEEESSKIKFFSSHLRRGWGSVRVSAQIGEAKWDTSIFPMAKDKAYILPIKAAIRKKENIEADNEVEVELEILT